MNKIIHGNCLEKLKTIKENSVDSIVTDPPYELGFMGKSWDNSGIAYKIEMWRECFRVLKPGGHLLSFGGTRTYHRMACAIEDAGFEIRDMIEWVYGSGFPKSLDVSKAIDKAAGAEREVVGQKAVTCGTGEAFGKAVGTGHKGTTVDITAPATPAAQQWDGWGTALKPAHEPICMARKPLAEKTVAENCLKWRTGGINVDESRVGPGTGEKKEYVPNDKNNVYGKNMGGGEWDNSQGRFPANLIHDNSEEVRECFPETGQPGNKRKTESQFNGSGFGVDGKREMDNTKLFYDAGNASRFFKSIIYTAKASKSERNKGNDLPFWFSGAKLREEKEVRTMNDFGDQSLHKCSDGVKRTKGTGISKSINNHPTVKPIALMEYLIKMVTPKGGTVLDPFAGSGSTLVAAKQNGFQYIGIEMIEEYIPIIQCRVDAVKVARACLMFFDYQKNHHKRLKFTNNETPQSQNTKIKRRSSPPPQDNSTSNTKSKRKIKRRKK